MDEVLSRILSQRVEYERRTAKQDAEGVMPVKLDLPRRLRQCLVSPHPPVPPSQADRRRRAAWRNDGRLCLERSDLCVVCKRQYVRTDCEAVSYTHLTLPTNREV